MSAAAGDDILVGVRSRVVAANKEQSDDSDYA